MSIAAVEKAIKKKINAALEAAVTVHSQLYFEEVTAKQTTPVGSHKAHGEIHEGQVVERSVPGEYPRREFGDASSGIKTATRRSTMEARSGVTEEGMPLVHLSHGTHPSSVGLKYDRKGMNDTFLENLDAIADAARAAANAEPGK